MEDALDDHRADCRDDKRSIGGEERAIGAD
jgi:hypothetical protein